jgi:hypothetical protein
MQHSRLSIAAIRWGKFAFKVFVEQAANEIAGAVGFKVVADAIEANPNSAAAIVGRSGAIDAINPRRGPKLPMLFGTALHPLQANLPPLPEAAIVSGLSGGHGQAQPQTHQQCQ